MHIYAKTRIDDTCSSLVQEVHEIQDEQEVLEVQVN
jgi:hypothetical protein